MFEHVRDLSHAERRLWFLNKLNPTSTAYNLTFTLRLRGELDVATLHRSWGELLIRQPSLRTFYPATGGIPRAHVLSPTARITVDDLTDRADAESAALSRVVEHQGTTFDVESAPLVRALLLGVRPNDHVFSVVMHHIVGDGRSLGVLGRDLAGIYRSIEANTPLPATPSFNYADHVAIEQRSLSDPELRAFWIRKLHGVPALHLGETERAVSRGAGARRRVEFDASLSKLIRGVSRRLRVSPFLFFMSALQAALYRHARQEDFAVGTVLSGRTRRESVDVIGLFANTVAVRSAMRGGGRSFADVAVELRDQMLAIEAHQELPFDAIVEELVPDRRKHVNPVFQVAYVYQNAPKDLDFGRLRGVRILSFGGMTKFDMTLRVTDLGGHFLGEIEYDTGVVDASRVESFASSLVDVVRMAVVDAGNVVTVAPT